MTGGDVVAAEAGLTRMPPVNDQRGWEEMSATTLQELDVEQAQAVGGAVSAEGMVSIGLGMIAIGVGIAAAPVAAIGAVGFATAFALSYWGGAVMGAGLYDLAS